MVKSGTKQRRMLPIGAEISADGSVNFRVWAPGHTGIEVIMEETGASHGAPGFALSDERNGYFSGSVVSAHEGTRYRFRIDGEAALYPDPASRRQPDGPHGPSCVVDPSAFVWTDEAWRGIDAEGQVIYELHLGTFTPQGTVDAAIEQLAELALLGITVIELMPIADFPGAFGWGYDGVNLFAPAHIYGEPHTFRKFVDRAHALGLGVILDVVYNHFGPDGNYLHAFTNDYITDKHTNDWGDSLNFDGKNSPGVREYFISNAIYWIAEYHFDGFRLDATQQIVDESPTHILAELAAEVRAAAGTRRTLIVAENELQESRLVRPQSAGGCGLDGVWNDDFHHAAMVRLTGHAEAYYADYRGTAQEFLSALKRGYLYQGQRSAWSEKRRGTPAFGVKPSCFITFLQNHDQVAHSGRGLRIHALAAPNLLRAFTAMLLLTPGTPLLFQGQEFGARTPFLFFADHTSDLAPIVSQGRRKFLAQFPGLATRLMQEQLAEPSSRATFERCKLDLADRERNAALYSLHRDLIRIRKEDPLLGSQSAIETDGAVLNDDVFVLRFFAPDGTDRLLVVNLGADLKPVVVAEPLLAPPEEMKWGVAWSSEDPKYGGDGVVDCESEDGGWFFPGHAAVLLAPHKRGAVVA